MEMNRWSEEKLMCPYCPREYDSQRQLDSHVNANHWKKVNPDKRGKP